MALTLRLPEALEEQLEAFCEETGMSKSTAIRRALEIYLGPDPITPARSVGRPSKRASKRLHDFG